MIIFFVVAFANFAFTVFFAAKFYRLARRNAKDINAIAVRMNAIEDTARIHSTANSFRLSVLEKSVLDVGDTGFDLSRLDRRRD